MRKLVHAMTGLGLFAVVSAAIAVFTLTVRLGADTLGQLSQVSALKDGPMSLASEVFDRRGEKIGEFADERRYFVRLGELPPHVVSAFLSAEDKDFRRHFGVNPLAILRSAIADLRGGALRQGASTITQQVARLYFLDQSKTWERKAKEALLAVAIERKLTKDEILEIYLNRIYLGNHSYGIEAASRNYFRKHAADLDVGEAALLAGLPQSPSRYAPNKHAALAGKRQLFVLRRMEEDGALGRGDAKAWARRVVKVYDEPEDFSGTAPYFLEAVQQELMRKFDGTRLPQEGLRVTTTLDAALQRAAAAQLRAALAGARQQAEPVIPRDSKRRIGPTKPAEIEGALFSMDPRTGAVLAMQGGSSFAESQFNRAEDTRRRIAGLFVPVYVALALDRGFTLLSRIGDDPIGGRHLKPESGAPTLYDVLRRGLTLEASPLYAALGGGTVVEQARRMGLSPDREDLTLALGYFDASPEQVARAYSAFVSGGRVPPPYLIEKLETTSGRVLYQARREAAPRVLGLAAAYALGQALNDATLFGYTHAAQGVSPLAGGAAAATDDLHDAWFVGTLPTIVTSVWIGAENGQARLGANEAAAMELAIDAWVKYMKAAPQTYTKDAKPLPPPGDVAFVRRPGGESGARSVPVPTGDVRRF